MALSYIGDHADLALARVAQQYKESTKLLGLIESVANQTQELDAALWQLATERYLYSDAEIGETTVNYEASGVQLDVIGRIVGLERGNLTDAQYRLALMGRIKVLHSSGTAEELIAIYHAALPTAVITVTTMPPAYVYVDIDEVVAAGLATVLVRFVRDGRAAGVAGTLLWRETADSGLLLFSDADNGWSGTFWTPETSATQGLGSSSDPTTGGALSGAAG